MIENEYTMQLCDILVCPVCRGDLAVMGREEGLVCAACDKVYPIREEIPVMLAEEAIPTRLWKLGERRAMTGRGGDKKDMATAHQK